MAGPCSNASHSLTKILSLDSVPVSVEAVIYMRVRDATAAETNVEDYRCTSGRSSWAPVWLMCLVVCWTVTAVTKPCDTTTTATTLTLYYYYYYY